MRELFVTAVIATVFTPFLIVGVSLVGAQAMQSTNYRIESDSVNFGGGLSSSTNYVLEATGGEIATGESSSTNFSLKAGYQQMHSVFISLTGANAVTMTPSIPGISGGIANGSTTVNVLTDSPSGYQLTIASETSPSLQNGGDTIADYTPLGNPDFTFDTTATDAHFGYSPSGVDIVDRFRDDTLACNVGTGDTALACWDGLSTSPTVIAERITSNHPLGSTTTVYFRVGVGGSVVQPTGIYTGTTTLTALPL